MASFSAQLRVAGHVFPVLHCSYHTSQATNERGRVSAKVRHHPVELVLDVPDMDVLLAWAAAPHKRQAADIVFLDAASSNALETLHMAGAYCVSYRENFVSGDTSTGAYQCHITLSDPDGFTLLPGGPVGAFVAPSARDHGTPTASTLMAAPPGGIISDCTDSMRLNLQNQVKQNCKNGKQACLITDTCPDLEHTMETLNACIAARIKINTKCFKGGDAGHKKQVLDKINGLVKCQGYYFSKCNKPPQPVVVPQKIPRNEPVTLPPIPKEVPFTIAGVGLFILYLISGAFRPGPI